MRWLGWLLVVLVLGPCGTHPAVAGQERPRLLYVDLRDCPAGGELVAQDVTGEWQVIASGLTHGACVPFNPNLALELRSRCVGGPVSPPAIDGKPGGALPVCR